MLFLTRSFHWSYWLIKNKTHHYWINCPIMLPCNRSQSTLTDRPTKNKFPSEPIIFGGSNPLFPLNLPISCWQHFPCSGDPTKRSSGLPDHDSGILPFSWASFGANSSIKVFGSCLLIQYHTNLRYGKSFKIEFPQKFLLAVTYLASPHKFGFEAFPKYKYF